jgi:AcrR family transcriptional regulator
MRKEGTQERSRDTVQVILQAAAHVFSELGYAGGTTNRIAERAGVSVGSLYQYFPNKNAILVKLARSHIDEARRLVGGILADAKESNLPLERLLRSLTGAMVSLHRHDPRLHRVIFEETPWEGPLEDVIAEFEEFMVVELKKAVLKAPNVETTNPDLAARLVAWTIESMAHHFVLYENERFDDEELIDEIVLLVLSYLFNSKQTS